MNELIKEMRLLNEDHAPDGWPAVRMSEINELVNIIEQLKQHCEDLEQWIAGIADSHHAIPDWIQQSARSLLAQQAKEQE